MEDVSIYWNIVLLPERLKNSFFEGWIWHPFRKSSLFDFFYPNVKFCLFEEFFLYLSWSWLFFSQLFLRTTHLISVYISMSPLFSTRVNFDSRHMTINSQTSTTSWLPILTWKFACSLFFIQIASQWNNTDSKQCFTLSSS